MRTREQQSIYNRDVYRLFGTIDGIQVHRVRRPQKKIPAWAQSESTMRAHILKPALRRYRIAYLYYLANLSAREIAEELDSTPGAINSVIHFLNKPHRTA